MGSASISDASQKALEPDLVDIGNRLLALPSSTDELLILLENAESLLARVWQRPPKSTCNALLPVMKALITNDILRHVDLNVQVTVASCFNELTRITAPDPPYSDGVMRVFFQLFMIAFKQLPCESGLSYARALQILETMAKVRSSLMLMDIDTDGLIVEMFQLFLNNIRSTHPSDVFKYMEMIMTLVIEESDEISFELLRTLIASVKMDNKKASSISWELGKKVLENCATKVQHDLKEAMKAMDLNISDYAEIVTSICLDTSSGKKMIPKEAAPTVDNPVSQLDGLSEAEHQERAPQIGDGNGTKLDDENSLEKLKGRQQTIQSAEDTGALRRKRPRKLNSAIRPDEGHRVSSEGYNEEEKDFSELGNSSMPSDSSQKKSDSVKEVSLQKRGWLKKVSTSNQHSDLEFSSGLKRRVLQNKVKEGGFNGPKKTGMRAIAGSSNKIFSDTDTEEKQELLPEDHYEKKEIISQKHVRKDKMEEFPISKSTKSKNLKKEKEKKSRKSQVNHGEELVNSRIQVWWPMDKMFYAGTVKAFDPVTKKHTIMYDDDEIEILNLRKETWEMIADKQPHQKREADYQTPAKEPVKTQDRTTKRKTVLSKKHAASSSKRSKGEYRSREISPPNSIHGIRESDDDEMCERKVSPKDNGESHAGKEESDTLVKKTATIAGEGLDPEHVG